VNKNKSYEELQLLNKISQGNELAFKSLFERYRNQLYTYLFKITKSSQTAEEIVLDVFLKIWHGRQTITQIENFDQFLFRVAHNMAIDFLKSPKRNPLLQQEVWNLMHEPKSEENADNKLLLKNTEAIIGQAIDKLSPQRQKVFYLHHHLDLTNEEIAQKLNLTKNTVRNHLCSSIEFVRKYITLNVELILLLFLSQVNLF
jgi:RNA polymerase sigma-70 factor (ECF subfamily)